MTAKNAAKRRTRSRPAHPTIWTGSLRFGLVNVPVKLYGGRRERPLRFHQLHDADGARIRMERRCTADGAIVPYEHIVNGFEIEPGHDVPVTREELASFDAEATKTLEIESFVDPSDLDPMLFQGTYYVAPAPGAEGAYDLLAAAMERRGKVGIARIVLRTRQHVCALRQVNGALMLSTLGYADEIIPASEIPGLPAAGEAPPERELRMAEKLIDSLTARFHAESYRDEHRDRVLAYLRHKAAGAPVTTPPPPAEEPEAEPADLAEALRASLEEVEPANEATRRRRPAA
jgi:DNA end-binding protein Ku